MNSLINKLEDIRLVAILFCIVSALCFSFVVRGDNISSVINFWFYIFISAVCLAWYDLVKTEAQMKAKEEEE